MPDNHYDKMLSIDLNEAIRKLHKQRQRRRQARERALEPRRRREAELARQSGQVQQVQDDLPFDIATGE